MVKPLAIDLFTGLHGFGDAAAAEGYCVVGFDIADMCRSTGYARNPNVQLVLQDVLTIHGSQFRGADLIWASPPCQQYSWLAMPWSRSKSNNSQKAKALRAKWEAEGPDNRLFEACFRIQREASEAAGHHIPMVVENVRGAQEWVGAVFCGLEAWMKASREERWRMGRSGWNHNSFHLWGDVPALMPIRLRGQDTKMPAHINESIRNGKSPARWTNSAEHYFGPIDGTKIGGDWFRDPNCHSKHGSRSSARKLASALIARIPEALASHIARVYYPR